LIQKENRWRTTPIPSFTALFKNKTAAAATTTKPYPTKWGPKYKRTKIS